MCLNFLQWNLNKTFNSHPLENKLHRGNPCANTSDWIEDWNFDLMPFTSRNWQCHDTTSEIREDWVFDKISAPLFKLNHALSINKIVY